MRGPLRFIFLPLLLTKEDKFHSEFISFFDPVDESLDLNQKQHQYAYFFLSDLPRLFFEELFLKNKKGEISIPIIKKCDIYNPREAAYLTQAFVVFFLEQTLITNPDNASIYEFDIEVLEEFIIDVYGDDHSIIQYLNRFRKHVYDDDGTPRILPNEWMPLYYEWICQLLYSKEEDSPIKVKFFSSYANSPIAETIFNTYAATFLIESWKIVTEAEDAIYEFDIR